MSKVSEFICVLDELELLEAHLETHKEFGWITYICESDKTVSGLLKPRYFQENEAQFSRFNYRYVDIPGSIYELAEGPEQARIFTRKNDWAKRYWLHSNIRVETPWAIHNDVDEIFKPELLSCWESFLDEDWLWLHHSIQNYVGKVNYKATHCPNVYRLYRLNGEFAGPKGCKRRPINDMKPVAWHFNSCFSTAEQLRNKVLNRAWYYDLNSPKDVPPIEYFEQLMKENQSNPFDPITRKPLPGRVVPLDELPKWMKENIHLFPCMTQAESEIIR